MAEFGIDSLAQRAAEANAAQPGDYINDCDDLLYCGKCHTPKQHRLPNTNMIVSCLCRCAAEKYNQERAEAEHRRRVDRLREQCFDVPAMEKRTFENDSGGIPVMDAARKYVEHFEEFERRGRGLLLWGKVGCGKSYAAAAICNALCEQEISCRYASTGQILGDLKNFRENQREYFDRLNAARLLVIDDLGSERGTEYASEIVFGLIDLRCCSGKPLIVTTNLTIEEIKAPPDVRQARIYSRLLELCHPLEVKGPDQRKVAAVQEFEAEKLLGL